MAHGPPGWAADGASAAPLGGRVGVSAPLLAVAALFTAGWWRLRRRSPRSARAAQACWYAAGIGAAALTLCSPLDRWAEGSFSVHMVQHLLLVKVAAPAMLLADPLAAMLWGLPGPLRARAGAALAPGTPARFAWRALTRPSVAWSLYFLTLWLWHVPVAWNAALGHRLVHDLEHLAFFTAAVLFWWPLARPAPHLRAALPPAGQVVYLVLAAFAEGVLGLFLVFAPWPLYPANAAEAALALADQARGGILMWGAGGAIDMIAVLVLLWRAMGSPERAPTGAPAVSVRRSS